MRLLHIDPDADCRARVSEALPETASYAGAATANAGLDALREHPVDCLVTEFDLPSGDGLSVLERVDDVAPHLPVVVYTDEGGEAVAGEVVAAGADGYVPKRDPSTLASRIDTLVAEASPAGERSLDGSATDAERAVGRSDRYDLLFEQSPLGVIEWDLDLRPVTWNPAAEALFGYDAEEVLGRAATDLIIPDAITDEIREGYRRMVETGEPDRRVNENVRADGTRIACEWHNAPLVEDGEVVSVISFVRDVTERERRSRTLESLQGTAEELIRLASREEIANVAVTAARDILGHPAAAVRLYDPDEEVLELAALTEEGWELLSGITDDPPPIRPGENVLWDAFAAGDPLLFDDLDPSRTVYEEEAPVRSLVVQPLGDHGVLAMGAPEAGAFDEADVRLASILARTVEAAMDRAERQRELERYETIVEAAGDAVFALDDEGRYTEVNDKFLEAVGYDREEVLGAHPSLFLDDDDVERGIERVRELVTGESEVVTYEVTVRRQDGEAIPCELSQSRLPAEEFAGTVGTARDITDRKRVERELRERERKIEALHAVARELDGCETVGEVTSVAVDAAENILDFDECGVRRHDGSDLVLAASSTGFAPERRPDDSGLLGRIYQSGERQLVPDVAALDVEVDNPRGFRSALGVPLGEQGVFMAVSYEPDGFDPGDAELAELLASHVTDALQQIDAQRELRAERDRFAALFENVPDPVVSVAHTGEGAMVREVNDAFEERFGYDAAEIVGEDLDEYIVPPDGRDEADRYNREAISGEVVDTEVRRRTADGLREFALTIVPVESGDDHPVTFGVYTDVTERKQRRKRVEVLNRVLRHDLRNGMTLVRGAAELLAEEADGDLASHAETIVDHAEELLALAERTRAIEHSLDRDASTTGPVDLASVVREARSDLLSSFPGATITFDGPDRAVVAGEEVLRKAIYDVVENALVHNDRADPTVEVTLCHDERDDTFVLSVADDGPGIPEEERQLLTGYQEITQLRHGSGLGLWLVHWAVAHSGGELSFSDNDPRGSVVTIRLPRPSDAALNGVTPDGG